MAFFGHCPILFEFSFENEGNVEVTEATDDGNISGFGNAGCAYGGVLWGNRGIALEDDMTRCQAAGSFPPIV